MAATALEARSRDSGPTPTRSPANSTIKLSATQLPFIAAVIYFISATLVTSNVPWNNSELPRLGWLAAPTPSCANNKDATNSAFVIAAKLSGIPRLGSALTVFLMFTAITAANTALYVASRTLFSLTRRLEVDSRDPHWKKFLASFGKTNHRRVPMKAVCASCFFCWIPFLYLASDNGPDTTIAGVRALSTPARTCFVS